MLAWWPIIPTIIFFFMGYNITADSLIHPRYKSELNKKLEMYPDSIKFLYRDHWFYKDNGLINHDSNCIKIDNQLKQ